MLRRLFDSLYEEMLSRKGLALLALALLVNFASLLAVNWAIEKLDEARGLAEHSRDVTAEILSIQSMMYQNESAQRGFLFTQLNDYLAPLQQNKDLVITKLARLRELVADNLFQQVLVDRVRDLAMAKATDQDKAIAVQQMGQSDAARAVVIGNRGRNLMAEIDKIISGFLVQEELVRLNRTQRSADIQLAIRWGFAAILFINALMILAGTVTIMRGMARNRVLLARHDEREAVLESEIAQRATELRALSAHLIRIQEEERRTIARDLHDELGGTLSAVKMDIIMGRDAAAKRSDEKSVARLQRALAAVDSGVQFVRRLIEDLRPTLLDNLGFEAALRSMVEQFAERANCTCIISLPEGELNLTPEQSTALYRVCQEALTNIMKYAKAKRVTIGLAGNGAQWSLVLVDDGVGLEATQQHRLMSHGLLGMRERMVALGGNFDIRGPAGQGTTLNATFPVVEIKSPAA